MSEPRKKWARHLVTIPETFKPQRPWDLPEVTTGAELYAKNLCLGEAQDFCRLFPPRSSTGVKWQRG